VATAGEPLLLQQNISSRYFETGSTEHDDGLSAFFVVRPRLFGIAYHMLGSAAEAEDIVQDVWLRWQATDRSLVEDPRAFLATTTTRLCINLVQAARSRRETCIEGRVAEAVDPGSDPESCAERSEALRNALLILLEKLSPTERAAYILREAFDYSYRHIAEILRMEEANARQLVFRARRHIADDRRALVSSDQERRLLQAFTAAAQTGDMAALEGLFVDDVACPSTGPGLHERGALELQRLLSQGGNRAPRVFMTARGDEDSKAHALQAGAMDFFPTSESIAPLSIAIRRALENVEYTGLNWEEL
jgi:RNA polymerase sigma-70 factor, ECF subfamily